ncbi:MAG: protoporphyrinogen oxidase, partial [Candidatus Saccharimonas sp.]|nr:protoporphyrinogen oxidase [Planctomycetaceae bacterium]
PQSRGEGTGNLPVAREGYRIELADGSIHSSDAVIVAAASYHAANLLGDLDRELASLLGEIEYASSALVVTGHRLADVAHPLNAFGLVVPQRERRKILAVSFSSRKFPDRAPDGSVLLRTFVGGALQPELFNLSDTELVSLVLAELADIFGVCGEPELARVYRYPRAMPQYHVGHLDRVARIEALAARHPGLALAGNAYRGVGVPDVIQYAESAAGRLLDIGCH